MGQLLHDLCGGPLPGRQFKAIVPGGGSMKILRYDEKFKGKKPDGEAYEYGIDDIPLDFDGVAAAGSMSGSAGMMVMDDSVDILEALANLMQFYAHESCGQCTPCREGSQWARKITARMCSGNARPGDLKTLYDMAGNIGGRTICPMGFSTTWPVQSYIDKFRDEIEAGARENRCGMPREARLIQK
jgi:NADH-quinone oxidoreductase subunit F